MLHASNYTASGFDFQVHKLRVYVIGSSRPVPYSESMFGGSRLPKTRLRAPWYLLYTDANVAATAFAPVGTGRTNATMLMLQLMAPNIATRTTWRPNRCDQVL